jgi:hypothetical protein
MDTQEAAAMERVELLFNTPRRIEVEAGAMIRVEHGRIWLTLTDLAQDIVLTTGQTFCAPHAGRVVVEAWNNDRRSASIIVARPRQATSDPELTAPDGPPSIGGDRDAIEREAA